MPRRRLLRILSLTTLLVAILAIDGQQLGVPASDGKVPSRGLALAPELATSIQSCIRGQPGWPATTVEGCGGWATSGPVNVVLIGNGSEVPYEDALRETKPRWHPAQGGWLVARLHARGCDSTWYGSESQIELRIDPVTRRHFKFIRPGCRWAGHSLTVGEAHTDLYEPRRCGGDHMSDLDHARDALVASLLQGGVASRVEYRQQSVPGTTFPDGCGAQVATDGRVACVWLAA
jgi:hypothetical protein